MIKVIRNVKSRYRIAGLSLLLMSPTIFAGGDVPHWSYEGEEGPTHWGELAEEYMMCSKGVNQSPIDIVADVHANLPELEFDYRSATANDAFNGHTIQQNISPGSFLRIPDRGLSYELKQFHFHSPSEHTIKGEYFDMEVHFVHANEEGAFLVVGALMTEGKENPVLNSLRSFMPEQAVLANEVPLKFEETNLLPPTREYFAYGGSLTTPPCSEGVSWLVLKTPIEASARQIKIFKERVGEVSNLPSQPHNARLILD